MNKFKKNGIKRAAFLVFALAWLIPLLGYAQQLPNQPNIPRSLLEKLQGPQALKKRLLAQKARAAQMQTPADKCKKCDELRDKVRKHGSVKVIVIFNIPDLPDPTRMAKKDRPQAEQARKEAIAMAQEKLLKRMEKHNTKDHRKFRYLPFMSMTVDAAALEDLISNPDVIGIGESGIKRPKLPQSVPLIGADQAWSKGFTGSGYTIAILDTGVDSTHPFLAGKVDAEACFSTNDSGTDPGPWTETTLCPNGLTEQTGSGAGINCSLNDCDHGTHVAGIAAGHEYSGISFSGVAKAAHIIPMQLYSQATGTSKCTDDPLHPDSGPCIVAEDRDIISAMDQVLVLKDSYNIAAVNLSLGSGQYDHICDYDDDTNMAYKIAIDDLRNAGIATVVSSGNEGFTDSVDSPACISSAISVGATTKYDRVPSYSNSASFLSLLAPGGDGSSSIGDIYSSVPLSTGMTFSYEAGTSMATPHVSGAFAVLKQQSPTANVDDILSILKSYGVPVNDTRNNITKPRIDLRNPPWIARYSPDDQWESKIAVDSYGNTYMTGFSSQGYTTIKYDPRGNQIWVQYFNGGDFSRPVDLALDSLGNVYVTGIVFTNTACTSTSCGDLHAATIKYDAGGNQSWLATRNGGLYEFPSGIVVDAADNVYITSTVCSDTSSWENNWGVGPGWIIGPPCHWSKNVTVKYDHQNGNQLAIVDYANGTYMTAHGIVSDELSNVYVAGYACASSDFYTPFTSCSNNNFIIIKYGSNLNQLWVKTYNSGGSMYGLKKIRLDSLGNVYATGSSCYSPNCGGVDHANGAGLQFTTIKYGGNSNMIWAAPYSNIGGDYPTDLVVDGSGNVYVTGGSCSSIDPNSNGAGYPGCVDYDWATVKYSPEGLQQWVARYSETSLPGYWDEPTAIGIDSPGNVYVAGYAGMEENFTLIKYDPSGNQTWVGSFGPGAPTSLVVDVMGNVYVTGESCRDADCSALDYLTLKHTPNNTVNNTPPTITALVALTNQLFTSGAIDNMGIANSLRLKLSNALAAKNNGNTQSSNNMLNAFINQVTAQSGKHISAVAAATLVNAATSIVNH